MVGTLKILQLFFSQFKIQRILSLSYVRPIRIDLQLRDRLEDLGRKHSMFYSPTSQDLDNVLKTRVLSAPFYDNLLKQRLERALKGREADVLDTSCISRVPQTIDRLQQHLMSSTKHEAHVAHALLLHQMWKPLEQIVSRSFPQLLNWELSAGSDPEMSRDWVLRTMGRKNIWDVWRIYAQLLPDGYLESLWTLAPDVIFLHGAIPANLRMTILLASVLRVRLPKCQIFLWQTHGLDLYSFPSDYLESFLASDWLFDRCDGIVGLTSLSDLTFCQVLERLDADRSLEGIENLIFRHRGKPVYTAPSVATVSEYLDNVVLSKNLISAVGHTFDATLDWQADASTVGFIIPTKQRCYWGNCAFCHSPNQSGISVDPHLEKRSAALVKALHELAGEGAVFSFVGFDVMPPPLMRNLVDALSLAKDPPRWAFEGKFDQYLLEDGFVEKMARAGCVGATFGLETSSDRINRLFNKYCLGIDLAKIEWIIGRFDAAQMVVHVNTIADLPTTTSTEYYEYMDWLTEMFDRHDFFSFNTNRFFLQPGTEIFRNPATYGIELEKPSSTFMELQIPFKRVVGNEAEISINKIWESVIGVSTYGGVDMNLFHQFCQERTPLLLLDTIRGINGFKTIQTQVRALRENIVDQKLQLAEDVSFVASASESITHCWLVHATTCDWIRLSPMIRTVLEASENSQHTLAHILEHNISTTALDIRDETIKECVELVLRGFVCTVPSSKVVPTLGFTS